MSTISLNVKKLSYFADFYGCPVVAVALLARSIGADRPHGIGLCLFSFAFGVGAWTFVEYSVHRWIYHHAPILKDLHAQHHEHPRSYDGTPAFVSIILIVALIYGPLTFWNGDAASGAAAGMLVGYLGYLIVHHLDHFYVGSKDGILRRARSVHARHHVTPQPGNFGVTTSFWDRRFHTVI